MRYKILSDLASIERMHPKDAGLDLVATELKQISREKTIHRFIYGTGIAIELPTRHVGIIKPRSSVPTGYWFPASGVIDEGYRGEIRVIFESVLDTPPYSVGQRIAQLLVMPITRPKLELVYDLSETERGEGGFGSTGTGLPLE